jgi:hypothetical protein
MKIKGTQYTEIEISEREQDKVMFARLNQRANWNDEYYIEDGIVKIEHDRKPRDWVEDIRKATEKDELVYRFYREILNK